MMIKKKLFTGDYSVVGETIDYLIKDNQKTEKALLTLMFREYNREMDEKTIEKRQKKLSSFLAIGLVSISVIIFIIYNIIIK